MRRDTGEVRAAVGAQTDLRVGGLGEIAAPSVVAAPYHRGVPAAFSGSDDWPLPDQALTPAREVSARLLEAAAPA